MSIDKTSAGVAALRREILRDLEETSDEELWQEALAAGEDPDAVANETRSTLRAAVAASYHSANVSSPEFQSPTQVGDPDPIPDSRRLRRFTWGVGAAVATVLVSIAVIRVPELNEVLTRKTYSTATGESRTVTLSDGSRVTLNTQTHITWVGTDHEREVELKNGEALFEVTQDKSRPFRIILANSEIRVLGTELDVYRKADGTNIVTVIDGTVSISSAIDGKPARFGIRRLTQNQKIEYTDSKLLSDVHPTQAREAIAWSTGDINIEGATLIELVDELNRYSTRPIILVTDHRLDTIRVVATLSIRNMDDALKSLRRLVPDLTVSRTQEGAIVLSYRPESSQPNPSADGGGP